MTPIRFWNGNKSAARQVFEPMLLAEVLAASNSSYSASPIIDDTTDYPRAEDEGAIFRTSADICVTVAGNPKFAQGEFISVNQPLMKGLLGHRLLIIREDDAADFACITREQLQHKVFGVPDTWADAPLFRENQFAVNEQGTLDTLFTQLKNKQCDYVALGANEIHGLFEQFAQPLGGLVIEPTLRLYYPYALVFYVHPQQPELADALRSGLNTLIASGEFDRLFNEANQHQLAQAQLATRREIALENPALPDALLPALQVDKPQVLQPVVSQ